MRNLLVIAVVFAIWFGGTIWVCSAIGHEQKQVLVCKKQISHGNIYLNDCQEYQR